MSGGTARWLTLVAVAVMIGLVGVAGTVGAQDATPEASPVAVDEEVEADPTPEPIRVITLVSWYQTTPDGEEIEIGPLNSNDQLIAGPGDPTSGLTGTAVFFDEDLETDVQITIGDSVFEGVPAFEGDPTSVFRWTYPGGDAEGRPATLVIEVVAAEGPYEGSSGTATFVSRSSPGSGVIVIMLNPPASE